MTVKELANLCNVHYNTMRKWLSDNKIKKADKAVNSPYLITDDVIKKGGDYMYSNSQKKSYQRSIRMTPDVHSIIENFEGESFNQKFENLVIYFSKVEEHLKINIIEKEKTIKKLDEKISEKNSLLAKLDRIESYVDSIIKSNPI